jgi:phage terminase small subunit
MPLTDKQRRFVEEYVTDWNGTAAAIRSGYSPKSAERIANELFKKSQVKNSLAQRKAALSKKCNITAERVLNELALLAFYDQGDVLLPDGTINPEYSKCIKKISISKKGTTYEFYDKQKSLELLGKHLNLFTENINISSDEGITGIVMLPETKKMEE